MNVSEIFKIFTLEQWKLFQGIGVFNGSPHDLRDGFIHMSQRDQVEAVIQRYFQDQRPLVVARFGTLEFGSALVWEAASNGDIFPHVYGSPLKWNYVLDAREIY